MAVPALIGASTLVGMAGANSQAAGQQAAANYKAAVGRQQATMDLAQAAEDERRGRIAGKASLGAIRSGVAASGVQLEGSALEVLESSASNAELDALTIRHQGQMKAWAHMAGAELDMLEGRNAREAGNFASAGYLLKGAGAAASMMGGGKDEK